jgi:beta-RFAP synthase
MDQRTLLDVRHAAVTVSAPARLHLGFLDLSGALGRRYGSLGLTIEGFRTRIGVRPAAAVSATGPSADRARRCALQLQQALGLRQGVQIAVHEAIPGHLGLGSGTQLSLAVGTAISRLYGLDADTGDIAALTERGARSGIGIGSFDHGGFLMDGGRGNSDRSPPLIARLPFPEEWRVVLLLDARGQGLHGRQEVQAFRRLPPFPSGQAADLCRLALMQILPALAECDLPPFAAGIAELQRVVGDYFAPAQGGRFTSDAVADALSWAEQQGFTGVGQSSWGPTGFVLADGEAAAQALVAAARRRFGELSPLRWRIVKGCNYGSQITTIPLVESLRSAR